MGIAPQSALRNLITELNSLVGNEVLVKLVDGTTYVGTLIGIDLSDRLSLHIVLENARTQDGRVLYKVFINGDRVSEIIFEQRPIFDPEEFAKFVASKLNIPLNSIRVIKEAKSVLVYDRYKVTENGVEGSGALASKLYSVFQEYVDLKKRGSPITT